MQACGIGNEHRRVEHYSCPRGCGGLGELVTLVHTGDLLHLSGVNPLGHTLSRRRCRTCRSSPPGARRDNYCRCAGCVGGCSVDVRLGPADSPGGPEVDLPQEFFWIFFRPLRLVPEGVQKVRRAACANCLRTQRQHLPRAYLRRRSLRDVGTPTMRVNPANPCQYWVCGLRAFRCDHSRPFCGTS